MLLSSLLISGNAATDFNWELAPVAIKPADSGEVTVNM
jgi:hypothetical protein